MVAAAEWALTGDKSIQSLVDLPCGVVASVTTVLAHEGDDTVVRRLAEIGFLPGETLKILARVPGGDPTAVRIGSSTFALHRHEARCIQVRVVDP